MAYDEFENGPPVDVPIDHDFNRRVAQSKIHERTSRRAFLFAFFINLAMLSLVAFGELPWFFVIPAVVLGTTATVQRVRFVNMRARGDV